MNNMLTDLSIRWSNSNDNTVIVNNTLVLPTVIPSLNNTQYTCTISVITNPSSCKVQNKTIIVTVKG